jgi:rhamnosyltransferase
MKKSQCTYLSKPNLKIFGVVVLYKPTEQTSKNIYLILPQVHSLILVCNSPINQMPPCIQTFFTHNNVYVIQLDNPGIATALNTGIRLCFKLATKKQIPLSSCWILTMDQDSEPTGNMIPLLINATQTYNDPVVAIYCPLHDYPLAPSPPDNPYTIVQRTMTSGNLLRLTAWEEVGGFLESLFIDSVDFEFNLRLQLNKWKIVQVNQASLKHSLGNMKIHFLFFLTKPRPVSHHPPLRRYYITRNRLAVAFMYRKQFANFFWDEIKFLFIDAFNIIAFEDNKLLKYKMMCMGIWDFLRKRFGKRDFKV